MGNFIPTISEKRPIQLVKGYPQHRKLVKDPLYLTKLRFWERRIQWRNYNLNSNGNNIPDFMTSLTTWQQRIAEGNKLRKFTQPSPL